MGEMLLKGAELQIQPEAYRGAGDTVDPTADATENLDGWKFKSEYTIL